MSDFSLIAFFLFVYIVFISMSAMCDIVAHSTLKFTRYFLLY